MAGYVWWFVIGFGLLVAELLSGTFYLLVIAVAMGVAGLVALAGAPFALQLVVAAAIGLGGSLWLRSTRFGKRLHERLLGAGEQGSGDRAPGAGPGVRGPRCDGPAGGSIPADRDRWLPRPPW